MMDVPESEERLPAPLRQPDPFPVEVQPGNYKSGVFYAVEHLHVLFQEMSETGAPGEKRVRCNHKSVAVRVSPDFFKGIELVCALLEIVDEDVSAFLGGYFHAGHERYPETVSIAGKSVAPDIGIVARNSQNIEPLPGGFFYQLFGSVAANAVIFRVEIAVGVHLRF